jgi:hypothetical protein
MPSPHSAPSIASNPHLRLWTRQPCTGPTALFVASEFHRDSKLYVLAATGDLAINGLAERRGADLDTKAAADLDPVAIDRQTLALLQKLDD